MRLLLLLLAGLCRGLQPGLRYTYRYRARLTAGLPEVRSDGASVVDLTATLLVWTPARGEVYMQMRDVQMGSAQGGTCDEHNLDRDLPVEYIPLPPSPGDNTVYFDREMFKFHGDETQGTMNWLKSVALTFSLMPVRSSFFDASHNDTFHGLPLAGAGEKEADPTILGRCRSTSTGVPLRGRALALFAGNRPLVADCQLPGNTRTETSKTGRKTTGRKSPGRKTTGRKIPGRKHPGSQPSSQTASCPRISSQVYKFIKTIHLDDCDDPPFFQDIAEKCPAGAAQCHNAFSRNAHVTYHVRGGAQAGYRIESVESSGAHVLSPLGRRSERVSSLSLSKLTLTATEPLSEADVPRMEDFQAVTSSSEAQLPTSGKLPANQPGAPAPFASPRDFMENLEGFKSSSADRREYVEHVVEIFQDVARVLEAEDPSKMSDLPSSLFYSKYLMYDFSLAELMNVKEALPPSLSPLLVDVVASVGTSTAMTFVLRELPTLPQLRRLLLVSSLRSYVNTQSDVEPVARHWLSMSSLDEAPLLATQLGVNTAAMLGGRCGLDGRLCGEMLAEFRSAVVDRLHKATEFWKQMVYVKMLVRLRDREATSALLPYIFGARGGYAAVRCVAMDSLASQHAADERERAKYVLILLELVENPLEAREVRARALGWLASWRLTAAEWSRLALLTRRRDALDLAALAYSLIRATADHASPGSVQQSQFAQHALLLARPASSGRRLSAFKGWRKYGFRSQLDIVQSLTNIVDPMSPLPSQLTSFMEVNAGGISVYTKFEGMLANDAGNLGGIIHQLMGGRREASPLPDTPAVRFLAMLKAGLDPARHVRGPVEGLVALRSVTGAELFLPLDADSHFFWDLYGTLSAAAAPTAGGACVYLEQLSRNLLTSNDLGLPVLMEMHQPTVFAVKGSLQHAGRLAEGGYGVGVNLTTLTVASELVSALTVALPSARRVLAAGVSVARVVSAPLQLKALLNFAPASPDRPPHPDHPDHAELAWPEQLVITVGTPAAGRKVQVYQSFTLPWTYSVQSRRSSYKEFQLRVRPIFASDSSPLVQKEENVTPFVTWSLSSDDTAFREDTTPSQLLDALLGSSKLLYHIVEKDIQSCKYSSEALALNLPSTSQFVSIKLNISRAALEPLPGAGGCGQSSAYTDQTAGESADFTQQTTGQHAEDLALHESQEDLGFGDFGSFGSQQQAAKLQHDAEEATHYGFSGLQSPQLQHYLSVLHRDPLWQGAVEAVSVRVEVTEWDHQQDPAPAHHSIDIKPHDTPAVAHRPVEVVVATTKCDQPDQTQRRLSLGVNVMDLPSMQICEEVKWLIPKLTDLDDLETITKKELKQTAESKVFAGQQCRNLVGTSKEERFFSAQWLNKTVARILKENKCSYVSEDVDAFLEHAIYDEHRLAVKGFTESDDYPVLKWMMDLNKSFVKQFWNFDMYSENCEKQDVEEVQPNDFVISSTRVGEQQWRVRKDAQGTAGPERTVRLRWPALEMLSRPATFSEHRPAPRCSVVRGARDQPAELTHVIRTFDGLTAPASLSSGCPVLLATSCHDGETRPFAVALKIGPRGRPTVFVTAVDAGVVVTVAPGRVKVNEREIDHKLAYYEHPAEGAAGGVGVRVTRHERGALKVDVAGVGYVMFKAGAVHVHVEDHYRGSLCGLCGDMDQEPSNDLKCPKNCPLTHPEDFSKAWTINYGFECSPGFLSSDYCSNVQWSPEYYTQTLFDVPSVQNLHLLDNYTVY